jgi:hypothetical protein
MRWTAAFAVAALAAILAAPAQATQVDMPFIDTRGNPLPGLTIVSNWGDGKVTQATTDSTGRFRAQVPDRWHYCSV